MNAATEARASRRVTTHVRLQPVSSDASKARVKVTVTETVVAEEAEETEARQNVAERVVAVAVHSERAAGRKRGPRLPMPSTEKWRTTGSRPVTRTRVSHLQLMLIRLFYLANERLDDDLANYFTKNAVVPAEVAAEGKEVAKVEEEKKE